VDHWQLSKLLRICLVRTTVIDLTGINLWFIRSLLFMIGLSGGGLVWWWESQEGKAKGSGRGGCGDIGAVAGGGSGDEVDALVRDAEARLAASNIAKGAKAGNLPAIFLLGPAGSAKTHSMVHSGLEPETARGQCTTTCGAPHADGHVCSAASLVVEAGGAWCRSVALDAL